MNYVIKECVQTCTESKGECGGSSLEVNCCTSALCNNAVRSVDLSSWTTRIVFLCTCSFLFFSFKLI